MNVLQTNKFAVTILGLVSLVIIVEAMNAENIHYLTLLLSTGVSALGLGIVLMFIYDRYDTDSVSRNKTIYTEHDNKYYDAVSDLNLIVASDELTGDDQIEEILHIGCRYLGTSMGRVSCVNLKTNSKTITKTVYSDAYKEHKGKIAAGKMLFVGDDYLLKENYVSAPIVTIKEFYGTVNFKCIATEKKMFSHVDKSLVVLIGSIISSVLERDLVQKALQDKYAAEVANKAKVAFVRNLSHELRTPLTAILGYSDILIEDAEEQGNKEIFSDVNKIKRASIHLLSLINDILDINKIDSGKVNLTYEKLSAELMLREIAESVQPLFQKNNNKLTTKCVTNTGIFYSDETKLRQIIINLLANASKFTKHGNIILEADREADFNGEWIIIRVIDSGIGLSEEEIQCLFGEFSQIESGLALNKEGSGLGLYISRQYCKLLGGDLSVESQPGLGSTFTVRLPVSPTKVSELSRAENVSVLVDMAS